MARSSVALVQNLAIRSEEIATSPWGYNTGVTGTNNTTDVTDPLGGNTASKIVYDASGGGSTYRFYQAVRTVAASEAGAPFAASIWLRTLSGTATLLMTANGPTGNGDLVTFRTLNITTTWQRFEVGNWGYTAGGAVQIAIYQTPNTAFTVYAWGAQVNQGLAATPYVRTTSAANDNGPPRAPAASRLVVPVVQNLLPWSEDLANAAWSRANLTATADVAVAPDGTSTADRLTDNTTNSVHATTGFPGNVVLGAAYTFSCYLKYENHPLIILAGNGGDGTAYVYFNIQTGVVASVVGANVLDSGIVSVGNGWFRCWNTFRANVNGIGPTFYWAQSIGVLAYAGTGTDTMLMWGAQMEQRNTVGGYVKTTAAAVNTGTPRGVASSRSAA